MTRVAITGGTGFVGRHVAESLVAQGHQVVILSRRTGHDVADPVEHLAERIGGCSALVHCAGINREIAAQTYQAVHVAGTERIVAAARMAGVDRIVLMSFLRARPDGPTAYHRSKWAAEQIVRSSGIEYTVVKAGVIYGRGDHMLDHLSHAFYSFPVFGLVGRDARRRNVRPVAVDDVARILAAAALADPRLSNRTVSVLGPDDLTLEDAVRRVARAVGRTPRFVRLPVFAQFVIARIAELTMEVPLLSVAQAHILAEGVTEPLPFADELPPDLTPRTTFTELAIRRGLPDPGGFGREDLRCESRRRPAT